MKADELRALCKRVADAWARYRSDDRDQEAYYACADAHRSLGLSNLTASREVASGFSEALDDERRQTQRRMIAALYWRAGEYALEATTETHDTLREVYEDHANMYRFAAADLRRVMEAACPR